LHANELATAIRELALPDIKSSARFCILISIHACREDKILERRYQSALKIQFYYSIFLSAREIYVHSLDGSTVYLLYIHLFMLLE